MQLQSDPHARVADESPRSDCPVEWWFVQGRYGNETIGMRSFMVSLFRHALEWGGISAGNAYTLLISVLDERSGETRWLSQIDPATIPFLVVALRLAPLAGLDPVALQAITDELDQCGLPDHLVPRAPGASVYSAPFRATWGDFELGQTERAFALQFTEPGTKRRCAFELTPIHPRFHLADVAVANGGSMDYVSYTRLALSGDVAGEQVTGEAWLDHQWGSQGWFVGGEQNEQIFGWDWLGIQLDDNRELLLMVIHDQRTGAVLCQYGVLVENERPARLLRDVQITPRADWTSCFSGAAYPVACHVAVPSLALELDFEPLADDQEIPVFAPIRAVWEGAGRVSGTFATERVAGVARLELHGYAYVLDVDRLADQWVTRFRREIDATAPQRSNGRHVRRLCGRADWELDSEPAAAMRAHLLSDCTGSRCEEPWRPFFATLLLGALGVDPKPYASLISAISAELLHGAKRVHRHNGIDVAINTRKTACLLPVTSLTNDTTLTDTSIMETIAERVCFIAKADAATTSVSRELARALDTADATGFPQETRAFIEEQWKRFSAHVPPSESKTMLRVLWNSRLAVGGDERYADFVAGS